MNKTLTILSVTRSTSKSGGWNVRTDDGEYWITPADKYTHAPNQPLADELTTKLNQAIELAVWIKEDGSVKLITGKPKTGGGGGGRPSGDYETSIQRKTRMESQEACQVLGTSRQLVSDVYANAKTPVNLEFFLSTVEQVYPRLLRLARSGRGEYIISPSARGPQLDPESGPGGAHRPTVDGSVGTGGNGYGEGPEPPVLAVAAVVEDLIPPTFDRDEQLRRARAAGLSDSAILVKLRKINPKIIELGDATGGEIAQVLLRELVS